jgi:hypothetical protein
MPRTTSSPGRHERGTGYVFTRCRGRESGWGALRRRLKLRGRMAFAVQLPHSVSDRGCTDTWMGSTAGDDRKVFSHGTEARIVEAHHLCGHRHGGRCSIRPTIRPDADRERLHRPDRWRGGWCRNWRNLGAAGQEGTNGLSSGAWTMAPEPRIGTCYSSIIWKWSRSNQEIGDIPGHRFHYHHGPHWGLRARCGRWASRRNLLEPQVPGDSGTRSQRRIATDAKVWR